MDSFDSFELEATDVYLAHRKKGDHWHDSIADFILKTTQLVQEKCNEDQLPELQQRLGRAYGEGVTWLYFTRGHRDTALAKGYERYPKGSYNSEAQVALARKYASKEVRLHEVVKELLDAITFRKEINNKALEMRKMDR